MDNRQQPQSASLSYGREALAASVWTQPAEQRHPQQDYFPLTEKVMADIAIIGAGITGLTTGFLLQQAGYSVSIIDAGPVGYGVTAFNSGHLTSMLLDSDLRRVIANFGEEAARIVTTSLQESIDFIENLARENQIECGFKRVPGYLFAETPGQVGGLREIEDAAERTGLRVRVMDKAPLPFHTELALQIADQGRFHPLLYTQGLAAAFSEEGGTIYTNSRVLDVKSGGTQAPFCIEAEAGQIFADEVVIATHTPIGFRPAIQSRLEVFRSYVIGIRSRSAIEDALFWDMEQPYHYIRETLDERGRLLVIGGADHRAGEKQPAEAFQALEEYAKQRFRVDSVDYRWSAQFYQPADGLPYIGKLAGTYIAAGFSGEGLTFGTLAARIIADQLQGRENPCGEILSPLRAKPIASAGGFIAENINTLSHFVKDRFNKAEVVMHAEDLSALEIPLGEGKICEIQGQKVAVYHSPEGVMHFLSPVCTHMRCLVGWNPTEKTWDCPCHGGRFSATGKVLNGPPVVDLEHLDL
jgi:glycine/D-amino acid oxidase-like deaminating enzyme/nitrite reductase/ring-hydroxylating ferredoxin subunit